MQLPALSNMLETTVSDDLFTKLVSQFEKDFTMSGVSYNFEGLTPQTLLVCLHEVVEHLLRSEYSTLLALLYRMDVSQSSITSFDDYTVEESLVIIMVKREWLKVQLRLKYS